MKHENKPIRWDVFIPCFVVIGGAALLGIVNNSWLTDVTYTMFDWSLSTFGWLYQIVAMATLLLACLLMFTKVGKIRFGGPEAVDRCIRSLGFDCFAIAVTEEEMHTDPACCYANRSAPSEMALLLDRFVDRAPFATEYRDFIVRTMLACTTGTDRLPAGLANTEAVIGHKTGTGDRNERGERIGFNDAGFVRMPDGEWYTITVFIRDSAQEEAETHAPLRKFRRRFSGISPA